MLMSVWTKPVMYLPYRFAGHSGKEFPPAWFEKIIRSVQSGGGWRVVGGGSRHPPPATRHPPRSGASPEIEANDPAEDQVPLVQVQAILGRNAGVDQQLNDHFDA